jgi:hypothetical protein
MSQKNVKTFWGSPKLVLNFRTNLIVTKGTMHMFNHLKPQLSMTFIGWAVDSGRPEASPEVVLIGFHWIKKPWDFSLHSVAISGT